MYGLVLYMFLVCICMDGYCICFWCVYVWMDTVYVSGVYTVYVWIGTVYVSGVYMYGWVLYMFLVCILYMYGLYLIRIYTSDYDKYILQPDYRTHSLCSYHNIKYIIIHISYFLQRKVLKEPNVTSDKKKCHETFFKIFSLSFSIDELLAIITKSYKIKIMIK